MPTILWEAGYAARTPPSRSCKVAHSPRRHDMTVLVGQRANEVARQVRPRRTRCPANALTRTRQRRWRPDPDPSPFRPRMWLRQAAHCHDEQKSEYARLRLNLTGRHPRDQIRRFVCEERCSSAGPGWSWSRSQEIAAARLACSASSQSGQATWPGPSRSRPRLQSGSGAHCGGKAQESFWPSSLARLSVSVVLHVDFLPQRVERVVSAGLDGAQWHAEGFGGLSRRRAAEVTLEEHLTVLGRQRP